MFSLTDIKAMAEECDHQKSGELSVSRLAYAVYFSQQLMSANDISVENIEMLGGIVEPTINAGGFRKLPVFIDGKVAGVDSQNIRTALEALCAASNEGRITADELYQEFESIHPFADGNGRVGFVLYNLKLQRLGLQATTEYVVKS